MLEPCSRHGLNHGKGILSQPRTAARLWLSSWVGHWQQGLARVHHLARLQQRLCSSPCIGTLAAAGPNMAMGVRVYEPLKPLQIPRLCLRKSKRTALKYPRLHAFSRLQLQYLLKRQRTILKYTRRRCSADHNCKVC
jgi:hypothetical protein